MLVVTVTTCPDASSDETDFAQCRGAALNAWDQGAIGFKQYRRVVKKLFLVFSLLIPRWLHGSNDSLSSLAEAASEPRLRSTDAAPWLPWHGTEVCETGLLRFEVADFEVGALESFVATAERCHNWTYRVHPRPQP